MTVDRDRLCELLVRFWGTEKVRKVTCGADEVPTAEVLCLDMWAVNDAVCDLLGIKGTGVRRVEFDLTGATIYRHDQEPEWVPFSDSLDMSGPFVK